jgi:hypothetical protein
MLYRLDTGERLRTDAEAWQAAGEARQAAEAKVARLRDELHRRDTPRPSASAMRLATGPPPV